MNIISLFAGAGGLDRGFENASFDVVWANEYDKKIHDTYAHNHPNTILDRRSIVDITSDEIPLQPGEVDGVIGGPPCQSWSLAGAMRGIEDDRGQLFYQYLRVLRDKKPRFFVAENVPGMVSRRHLAAFNNILDLFSQCGYNVAYSVLDANDYGVAQTRKRVFIVGYRSDLGLTFDFDRLEKDTSKLTLQDVIANLPEATAAQEKNSANVELDIPNHEYAIGGFSTIYMSRNRKKKWNEPSFTIQAGGRHAPLHPSANPMIKVGKDEWIFDDNSPFPYRRMSVRECAIVQGFPDNFIFLYNNVMDGYKMVGNAVPVTVAKRIAAVIYSQLQHLDSLVIEEDRLAI